jgi:hypothetical protein
MREGISSRLMRDALLIGVFLLIAGCAQQTQIASAAKPGPGKYTVEPATAWGHPEEEDEMDQFTAAFSPLTGAGEADQIKAQFRGNDRKAAKISIANARLERFDSLDALIETLPSDDDMRHHDPKITEAATQNRVDEEKRNVRVPAFICAIKYEADQDWHIIGSADADCDGPTFFNFEVSGLPKSNAASHDQLLEARNQFAELLDHDLPGPNTYRKYKGSGPIAVVIEGSLFYDVDHAPGIVGPDGMKPAMAWEVHPMTSIAAQ